MFGMDKMVCGAAVACAMAAALPFPAAAADADIFAYAMRPRIGVEIYLSEVLGPIRELGLREGDAIVTREQVDRLQQARDAQWAGIVKRGVSRDPNGDGRIEGPELLQNGVNLGTGLGVLAGFDRDGDGAVTRDELMQSTDAPSAALKGLLALGDGSEIHMSDVLDHAVAAFKAVDGDGDLKLSTAEYESAFGAYGPVQARRAARDTARSAFMHLSLAARLNAQAAASGGGRGVSGDCNLPKPSADALIVSLGAYEGAAMASVHVGSPDDETGSAEIVVEPGREPLYVVLSSHTPVIWRFTGAVDRIEKVVLAGSRPMASGVTGVVAGRLAATTTDDRAACLGYFKDAASREGKAAAKDLAARAGRPADSIGAAYEIARVAIPSMTFTPSPRRSWADPADAPPGFDPAVYRDALRFSPAGFADIDPASVAALAPVARYEVLPNQFGLSQLVASGQLQPGRSREEFRIVKPIARFPPSLGGAHAVRFVLAKGVPLPAGSPGHSCVVAEDGGIVIQPGARCR